jgi:flavin-dependent dehydrogenase
MYDVIVVGARCSGSPTAMLLARKGYKVLLVDRAAFPSEIPHGHFIHRGGPGFLHRWGILDRVASTCPAALTNMTDFGDFRLTGRDLMVNGVAWGYGPRRKTLDQILLDAAIEAGVEFRGSFTVESFETDGTAIIGIRGREHGSNQPVMERGRLVIGADGRNSGLARTVGAPQYDVQPPLTCWYFSYWSGVPNDGFEMYVREGSVVFSFVTSDDLFAIMIAFPIARFQEVKTDVERHFLSVIDALPEFSERVRSGRREERFYGTADLPNFFRKPYGPGWALVGDAGYHKDPYMALGIADAFFDADSLTEAIDHGFSGVSSLQQALAAHERKRNAAVIAEYQESLRGARLQAPPQDVLRLRTALRGRQEEINRFVMARMGMIPQEEFFNPENMQRILAGR